MMSGNIWLATFRALDETHSMKLSGQAAENQASRLATARYDSASADAGGSNNSSRTASPFSLTTILQIPVGYEDEHGFHRGEPRVQEIPSFFEPENSTPSTSTYQF
jgi:hypothetical protein